MSSEAQPSARAEAVLRAAQAAAAAAQRGDDGVQASPEAGGPAPSQGGSGVPARLLAAADDLEAQLAQARARLEELEAALDRLAPRDEPSASDRPSA